MSQYNYKTCLEIILNGQPTKKYNESIQNFNNRLDEYVKVLNQLNALVESTDKNEIDIGEILHG